MVTPRRTNFSRTNPFSRQSPETKPNGGTGLRGPCRRLWTKPCRKLVPPLEFSSRKVAHVSLSHGGLARPSVICRRKDVALMHPFHRSTNWVQRALPDPEPRGLLVAGRAQACPADAHSGTVGGIPRCPWRPAPGRRGRLPRRPHHVCLERPCPPPPACTPRKPGASASYEAAMPEGAAASGGQTSAPKTPKCRCGTAPCVQMSLGPTPRLLQDMKDPGPQGRRARPRHLPRGRPGSPAEHRGCLEDNYSTGSKDVPRGHKSWAVSMETHRNACCFY